MTVTYEGNDYHCSTTRPDIPFTIYVGNSYLLLVPREVTKVHPNFPVALHNPTQRFQLTLSDSIVAEYRSKYGREPKFSSKLVDFGLEDDEVVVAALLDGSNIIPYWSFGTLVDGVNNRHSTDISSDAKASFGLMSWDLTQAARE